MQRINTRLFPPDFSHLLEFCGKFQIKNSSVNSFQKYFQNILRPPPLHIFKFGHSQGLKTVLKKFFLDQL